MSRNKIAYLFVLMLFLVGCETTPYYGNIPGSSQQVSTISGDLNAADLAKLTRDTLNDLFNNNPKLSSWPQTKPFVKVLEVENLTSQLNNRENSSNNFEVSSLDFDLSRQIIKDELHVRGLVTLVNDSATKFGYYLKTYISQTSRQYDLKTGLPVSIWSMKISIEENKRRNPNTIATAIRQYP